MAINNIGVANHIDKTAQQVVGEASDVSALGISSEGVTVGNGSAAYYTGDITTLGVLQGPGQTVALSLRKKTGNIIFQFCGVDKSGVANCSYISYNPDTQTIGIGADGNGNNPVLSVSPSGIGGTLAPTITEGSPASSSPGTKGEMRFDASNLYVCTAANTWERTSLGSY